jgi:hypothetical protein
MNFFYQLIKNETPTVASCCSFLDLIPVDICHIIIEYVTNNFGGLYFLRKLSREWKQVAESSLLWRELKLIFYCPKEFLFHYQQRNCTEYPTITRLVEDMRSKDKFLEAEIGYELFENAKEGPENGYIRISCDFSDRRKYKEPAEVNYLNAFEESQKIFQWFHEVYRHHHLVWRNQIVAVNWIYAIDRFIAPRYAKLIPFSFLLVSFLFLLSFYGFYTLQANLQQKSQFNWENHLSFVCSELICTVYCFVFLVDFLYTGVKKWLNVPMFFPVFPPLVKLLPGTDMFLCIYCSIFIVVVLVHNFLANHSASLSWIYVLIPCWTCIFACFSLAIWHYKGDPTNSDNFMIASVLIGIFLCLSIGITLLCIFESGLWEVEYPYGYAMIPIFPLFGILILSVAILTYFIFENERKRLTPVSRFVRFANMKLVLSVLLMIFSMILLCKFSFVPSLSTDSPMAVLPPVFIFVLFLFSFHSWVTAEIMKDLVR